LLKENEERMKTTKMTASVCPYKHEHKYQVRELHKCAYKN
jgi:hypothetical protein